MRDETPRRKIPLNPPLQRGSCKGRACRWTIPPNKLGGHGRFRINPASIKRNLKVAATRKPPS